MSDGDAAPSRADRPRESKGAVLGVGLALLLLAVAVLAQLRPPALPLDGAARLAQRFAVQGDPPFGFGVARALRLPRGEVVVVLADPDGPLPDPELPPLPEGAAPARRPVGPGGKPWTDWSQAREGAAGTPPAELAFTWYPRALGERVLRQQFGQVRFKDVKHIKGEGESVPVDSGHLAWGPYEASYVRVRSFSLEDERPVFRDVVHVNLTVGDEPCVLSLRWPRGLPGSKERAVQVLAVYGPRPEA